LPDAFLDLIIAIILSLRRSNGSIPRMNGDGPHIPDADYMVPYKFYVFAMLAEMGFGFSSSNLARQVILFRSRMIPIYSSLFRNGGDGCNEFEFNV